VNQHNFRMKQEEYIFVHKVFKRHKMKLSAFIRDTLKDTAVKMDIEDRINGNGSERDGVHPTA